jgi:DAK2 domain fusion protein YloV
MAEVYGDTEAGGNRNPQVDGEGRLLAAALRRAAESAYEAVARPVEGTMLTVARAAADAAERAAAGTADTAAAEVARAAREAAETALSATTGQLDVLRLAGVVDAGGRGLVTVLGALADVLADPGAAPRPRRFAEVSGPDDGAAPSGGGPSDGDPEYEVMYLLDADDAAVTALRERLDGLGDSLVVGGGDGLWSVHVHVDDAGAAVEAGIAAGHPHRVRITHLRVGDADSSCAPAVPPTHTAPAAVASAESPHPASSARAVVAVVHGDGLAGLYEEAGAVVVRAKEALDGEALPAAVRATGAAEVVLLPNDAGLHSCAADAAEEARTSAEGVRIAVVPTRAAVQGIAALAVHDPERRFDDDVVAMTRAAGATRYGEVTVAERRSWTMAGVCQAGDVLGLVEGDVAVIGSDLSDTAAEVLERMLAAGGEMVTLVVGDQAPQGLAERLEEQVRSGHLAVDTVVYEGREQCTPLLIGVE